MKKHQTMYSIDLNFEIIKLPPVSDILVLGKKVPQGKFGVLHSFELISPDAFELLEIGPEVSDNVDGVIINKNILKKLPKQKILDILAEYVFPYASKGETLKVDFDLKIYQKNIEGTIDAD